MSVNGEVEIDCFVMGGPSWTRLIPSMAKLPSSFSQNLFSFAGCYIYILKKRKGSHVQADWKKCQPPPGIEPGTSADHDHRSNR